MHTASPPYLIPLKTISVSTHLLIISPTMPSVQNAMYFSTISHLFPYIAQLNNFHPIPSHINIIVAIQTLLFLTLKNLFIIHWKHVFSILLTDLVIYTLPKNRGIMTFHPICYLTYMIVMFRRISRNQNEHHQMNISSSSYWISIGLNCSIMQIILVVLYTSPSTIYLNLSNLKKIVERIQQYLSRSLEVI